MLISNNNKTGRREVWGLSYAGINRGQVQRVSLSLTIQAQLIKKLKPDGEAPLAFTDVDLS